MAMKIRLSRGGSKKRPYYSIVAADSRMPRDGRFLEKLGTYAPLLPKDSEDRVKMNNEKNKKDAPLPTMDDIWAHHGSVFYFGIREHIYGLAAPADRRRTIVDAVHRFLNAFIVLSATECIAASDRTPLVAETPGPSKNSRRIIRP